MQDNTTLIIVVSILALHFVVGIGWLIYKMSGSDKNEGSKQEEN
ncbi:hypothetical protein [Algoriphagus kandeliae]|nr:hypothetical protein [Algoriphagus kandeliae]